MGEWAIFIAISLYFYLTWLTPIWTVVGSVLSGSTFSRVRDAGGAPVRKFRYVRRPGVIPGSPYDRWLQRHASVEFKLLNKEGNRLVKERQEQFEKGVNILKGTVVGSSVDALYGGQLIKKVAEEVNKILPEQESIDQHVKIL